MILLVRLFVFFDEEVERDDRSSVLSKGQNVGILSHFGVEFVSCRLFVVLFVRINDLLLEVLRPFQVLYGSKVSPLHCELV